MPGLRELAARSALLPALAVYFFFFTNVIPSLHKCFPFADGYRGWEGPAGSAHLQEGNFASASRERADRTSSFGEQGTCVACIFSARLRGLSPPAGVSAPVLAQAQRLPRQAIRIPTLSDLWIQILPRAPPANTPS